MKNRHSVITGGAGLRERTQHDYYATPRNATVGFLENHVLTGVKTFLEPACGEGHISKVLAEYYPDTTIFSTDLVDRGYGVGCVDFLADEFEKVDVVITNLPFKHIEQFIEKALNIATKEVIMFAKLQLLETTKRMILFKNTPLKYVYVHSKRVSPMRNGQALDENGKPWSSAMCFAWFVWEQGYEGEPMIRWIGEMK